MSTLYLLKFPGNENPKKGSLDTPRAYIAINSSSIEKVKSEEFTTISSECRSIKEIEEVIDYLIEELKTIKRQSEDFFKKH